jgi:protein-tyrosine kinase
MLIPKPSHLVERVAERLLRSGALDDSAAQLLRPPGSEPAADAVDAGVPGPATTDYDAAANEAAAPAQRSALFARAQRSPVLAPAQQPSVLASAQNRSLLASAQPSSLFAPPPSSSAAIPQSSAEQPVRLPSDPPSAASSAAPDAVAGASLSGSESSLDDEAPPGDPVVGSPPPASPSIPGQSRALGQPAGAPAEIDRPVASATSTPSLTQRSTIGDPASGTLQGPASVDAVSLERAGMVDWSRTRTRISEEFRLVQRQIIRSAFGPGAEPGFSNLLLVTSARPGEGKSFMATNLSGSIARQGDHHVLLVDADSKRDSICYSLGLAQARGLLDLAANPKLDPAPLIVKTPIERLSILPVGRERERSAELFSTKEMTRLIQSLGRRYADRLLILDAPPCLSTSDPAVLAQVVGQILFVVEADRTQRDEIEASLDLIQACPTITMVLNKQQISSRYTFGAYSSYYSS